MTHYGEGYQLWELSQQKYKNFLKVRFFLLATKQKGYVLIDDC